MNKETGAFKTHQHYLQALAFIATSGNRLTEDACIAIKDRFEQNKNIIKIPEENEVREQLKKSLENAWGTELLLLLGRKIVKEDELVRLSNNWNVIQGYYAIYHATQALIIGKGFKKPISHPKTQTMFVDIWGHLPVAFAPWSLTMGSNGCNINYLNIDPLLHPWTSVDSSTCWSIACKALQTTREAELTEQKKKAREERRKTFRKEWQSRHVEKKMTKEPEFSLPRLKVEEKNKIDKQTRNYSLMDYFYRLRIRCNYIDTSMFIEGPEEPLDSTDVRVSIIKIISMTIFATELMLCSTKDGISLLSEWASKWVKKNVPPEMQFGVGARIDYWK